MRTIDALKIKNAVLDGYNLICTHIEDGAIKAIKSAQMAETNPYAKFALNVISENCDIAIRDNVAVCQDTGMAVVFVKIGQDVHVTGGNIKDAINEGVKEAYAQKFRKSVLSPLTRINTTDNTPAVIHYEIVAGENIELTMMAKGFGSENMSRLIMLNPSDGIDGVKDFVVDTVKRAGGCPCPPVIVGVGIGGTMEKAALMAKHSLSRNVGSQNDDVALRELEYDLKNRINNLDVGAFGYGGDTTALAVFVETYPTHIAGLPVAVNIQCHCARHTVVVL